MAEGAAPRTSAEDVPHGATMRPRYMARTMNTYPVSEPEMDQISSLNAQANVRYSAASLLLGLAASIWTNAVFVEKMTAAGQLAEQFVAPLLLFFSFCYFVGGVVAQWRRRGKWNQIKTGSVPVQSMAASTVMVSPQGDGD
jgi:hypothetical protein